MFFRSAQRYDLNYNHFYMDMSDVVRAGIHLKEIQGYRYLDRDGRVMEEPDKAICTLPQLGIPVIDFSGQWVSKDSLEFANFTPGRIGSIPFDYPRLIHSLPGKLAADAMKLEWDYDTADDPGLQDLLRRMGLHYGYHEHGNRGWVAITPQSALEAPEKKIPCVVVLQEIAKCDPRSIPSALSLWFEYLHIAAQGEIMLMFWVLEDANANDLLVDILRDAGRLYPFMDENRLFLTGHSHNAQYSLEFARRHPEMITGVATMGHMHGLDPRFNLINYPPEAQEQLRRAKIPCINLNGQWENGFTDDSKASGYFLNDERRVECWQARLNAFDCPPRTAEEILAASRSGSRAVRMLGVPADRADIRYFAGDECAVGDVLSRDGEVRLRVVTVQNLPHATSAHMPWISWEFLRRFARDPASGKIINLYER